MTPRHLALAAVVAAAGLAIAGIALAAVWWPSDAPEGVSAHRGSRAVDVPRAWRGLEATLHPLRTADGQPVTGGEPTIGADAAGTLYVAGDLSSVWRSRDGGVTWSNVSDRDLLDQDPYLWVDRDAHPAPGRVWAAHLLAPCMDLRWSDDGGDTWRSSPTARCGSAQDHPNLATGPPPAGVAAPYGRVAYYTYNSMGNLLLPTGGWAARSLDGGASWSEPVQVFDGRCQDGYMGATAIAPDGTAYIPKPGCTGLSVAVSTDAGATWRFAAVPGGAGVSGSDGLPVGGLPAGRPETFWTNPAAAVDEAGTAYVAWGGDDGRIHLSSSADRGATWSLPTAVSPPWIRGTAFSAMAALGDGRIAVAYLGTRESWPSHEAHDAPEGTEWQLYVTATGDAATASPLWVTLQATPDDDPVQRGCIWQAGLSVAQECRNLRDFIGATAWEGRPLVAFTDGCCDGRGSGRSDLVVAEVTGIPRDDADGRLVPGPGPLPAIAAVAVAAARRGVTSAGWRRSRTG